MEDFWEFLTYLIMTPLGLFMQLVKWAFVCAAVGITIYGAWFFLFTPLKYIWNGIKKLVKKLLS